MHGRKVGLSVTVASVIAVGLLVGATLWLPEYLVEQDAGNTTLEGAARAEAVNARRTAAYQALGGFVVVVGAAATLWQVHVNRETHLTDSFSRAVEQIGDDDRVVRIGGIITMSGIMAASPERRWSITNLLTAYVRQQSPVSNVSDEPPQWMRQRAPDVQAAIDAVVKLRHSRDYEGPQRRRNFNDSDLRKAHLERANLKWASLQRANLDGAYLVGADLRRTICANASFRGAELYGADLTGATMLPTACLDGAYHNDDTKWPFGFAPPPRRSME